MWVVKVIKMPIACVSCMDNINYVTPTFHSMISYCRTQNHAVENTVQMEYYVSQKI